MIIYARKTKIQTIAFAEAQEFIEKNHSASSLKKAAATINIGLFFEEELVSVAQFGPPRTNKTSEKYTTELYRLAFKENMRVIGGASKLLAYYKKHYKPADIFTYQDMTGEQTNVYAHCGMNLVSQAKTKQYLVAPGKTLATGNRKEVLGMPYATRYGPDRILGTKLGEIIDMKTGKRKPNKQIFLEELGWHIEETPGDRVWEWIDTERTYYTYKITAVDSDKYYFGVSHVKKQNASIQDCLNDGYYGSGGTSVNNKFNNWKKKHKDQLEKTVLKLFSREAEAYNYEKKIIGSSYSHDLKSLNSTSGGKTGGLNRENIKREQVFCSEHGTTTHQNNVCLKCSASESVFIKECSVHGLSKHRGEHCFKCGAAKQFAVNFCETHGETTFRNNECLSCAVHKTIKNKVCSVHGMSLFRGEKCVKCTVSTGYKNIFCEKHGVVAHHGDKCVSCFNESFVLTKTCAIHGETTHQGDSCNKCVYDKQVTVEKCYIHGAVKHFNKKCCTCSSSKSVSLKTCNVHGETKHQGDVCCKCNVSKNVSLAFCEVHGEVKHKGNKCITCFNEKTFSMQQCAIHGETKFKKDSCVKCSTSSIMAECSLHGLTKHRGKSCYKCRSEKSARTRTSKRNLA